MTKRDILIRDNIHTHCNSTDRLTAIRDVGLLLVKSGYVDLDYIDGMIERDNNLTTYIGNYVAIPHGEYESKQFVKYTGISIMTYPNGISWEGNEVKIVIGIAANNDDHMNILSQLAIKLSDPDEVESIIQSDVDSLLEEFNI